MRTAGAAVLRRDCALGRVHAGRTVCVHVSEHTLAIELDDETRTIRRTTSRPVVVIKGSRPHNAARGTSEPALSSSPVRATQQPQQT